MRWIVSYPGRRASLPVSSTASARASSGCGPFGNAPQSLVADMTITTCAGGVPMAPWLDGNGMPRGACLYEPALASPARPLPLVVYLHPSLFTADTIPFATNLLLFRDTADLTGDPTRPGFILLAPQGRATTHYYPAPDDQGSGWQLYRQLDPSGGPRIVSGGSTRRKSTPRRSITSRAEVATGKVERIAST